MGLGFVKKCKIFLEKYQFFVFVGGPKCKKKGIVDETGLDSLIIGNL